MAATRRSREGPGHAGIQRPQVQSCGRGSPTHRPPQHGPLTEGHRASDPSRAPRSLGAPPVARLIQFRDLSRRESDGFARDQILDASIGFQIPSGGEVWRGGTRRRIVKSAAPRGRLGPEPARSKLVRRLEDANAASRACPPSADSYDLRAIGPLSEDRGARDVRPLLPPLRRPGRLDADPGRRVHAPSEPKLP
jgi:hypothetical protein